MMNPWPMLTAAPAALYRPPDEATCRRFQVPGTDKIVQVILWTSQEWGWLAELPDDAMRLPSGAWLALRTE